MTWNKKNIKFPSWNLPGAHVSVINEEYKEMWKQSGVSTKWQKFTRVVMVYLTCDTYPQDRRNIQNIVSTPKLVNYRIANFGFQKQVYETDIRTIQIYYDSYHGTIEDK